MSGIDWEAAANHWIAQESAETRMPWADLVTEIEAFLARHKICTLATAGNGIVRNTTVEYLYAEGGVLDHQRGRPKVPHPAGQQKRVPGDP